MKELFKEINTRGVGHPDAECNFHRAFCVAAQDGIVREKDLMHFLSIPDNAYEMLGCSLCRRSRRSLALFYKLRRAQARVGTGSVCAKLRTAKMCRVPVRHVQEALIAQSLSNIS